MSEAITQHSEKLKAIVNAVGTAMIGKEEKVKLVVLSLVSGGHVLLEDVPGVGKTRLVTSLSRAVDCQSKRIQFTPDTMPTDITGFSIYNQKTGEFTFRPGAVMSNFILADEINRASPKSQASLLEVMEEKQVTIDSETHILSEPFMVLATQNPIDNLGTYPLPEAQIDRFLIKISLGYASKEEERRIMKLKAIDKAKVPSVATGEDIIAIRETIDGIFTDEVVDEYIIEIVDATRAHKHVLLGASPRGSIALYRMSRALALYESRDYVMPDDVKYLAPFILSHRLILKTDAKIEQITPESVIRDILETTPIPSLSGGGTSK